MSSSDLPTDNRPVSGLSRPSKTNCADATNHRESAQDDETLSEQGERIPPILASFREEFSDLVNHAISMVPGKRLRRECTREIRGGDGSLKSRATHAVLKEFLKWYIEQENSQLVFESPEGREVTAPVPNSYSDRYGRKHYGKLKDIERESERNAPDLHTAMLSLTASTTKADGTQRPIADHLRGIQDTWNPYVRRELQRQMAERGFERYESGVDYDLANAVGLVLDDEPASAKWWEYATVVEPHGGGGKATGYGHFHVAVFTSHSVKESTFFPVIEKHIEECDHAGWQAHNYMSIDQEERPISVNRVDSESDDDDGEAIGNLGSYLSEYIGGFSGDLEERPMHELVFQAVCWATGTQRVRYSNGANRMAREGRQRRVEEGEAEANLSEPGWTVAAIENTASGERHPPAMSGGPSYMVPIHDGPPDFADWRGDAVG